MSNLVIVAIPSEDDYVHKISSEKIPHMTLLLLSELGKVKNFTDILDFTKHAADQSLRRFDMEVDHRGMLGPDQADVLFFSKSKWGGFETISNYRSNLLKNNNVRTAYDSVDQFPEWVPHITLGYPDTPANPDERDYPGIRYVSFDRIAIWYNEFEGIEFPLKAYDWEASLSMSNITAKDIVKDILSNNGDMMIHGTAPYDPVKAHEYYIRNRKLSGQRPARSVVSKPVRRTSTFTVKLSSGETVKLSQKQLEKRQEYAAKRVTEITKRLAQLGTELKKLTADAHAKANPTAADKSKAARESRQYRQEHRQELKIKAKTARETTSVKKKDPVAELKSKINQVKGSLKAAVEHQRILATAVKSTG